jgi:hypothetical protein
MHVRDIGNALTLYPAVLPVSDLSAPCHKVLDETASEALAEFQNRSERIDPEKEIARARKLVWGRRDPFAAAILTLRF